MKFYEVTPFAVVLTPEVIEAATRTLTAADLPALPAILAHVVRELPRHGAPGPGLTGGAHSVHPVG